MPKPYGGPLPSATPPKEIAVCSLVAGVNHRVAAFGYRGGSLFKRREFSMAGALVEHPKGDLFIDTGFGRNIDEQFRTLPSTVRAITFYSLWRPAAAYSGVIAWRLKSNIPPAQANGIAAIEGMVHVAAFTVPFAASSFPRTFWAVRRRRRRIPA